MTNEEYTKLTLSVIDGFLEDNDHPSLSSHGDECLEHSSKILLVKMLRQDIVEKGYIIDRENPDNIPSHHKAAIKAMKQWLSKQSYMTEDMPPYSKRFICERLRLINEEDKELSKEEQYIRALIEKEKARLPGLPDEEHLKLVALRKRMKEIVDRQKTLVKESYGWNNILNKYYNKQKQF